MKGCFMEVTIFCLGKDKDYYELRVDRQYLKEIFSVGGNVGERLLDSLRILDSKLPFNLLRNYGCTIALEEAGIASENVIDCLVKFFNKVEDYAEKHGANYALVQELHIGYRNMSSEISGLVQLLVED